MTFFQRIKTPFTESPADEQARLQPRMRLVGELLQERREELGLDLDEIGAMLRIKPAYLAALEQGRLHDLPGPTYAIGFVRAYADFLGLDAEAVLARFKAEAAGVTARPDLALPMPLGERSLPGGALVLVALILALCGYGIWYYLSTEERDRPERVADVPAALQSPPPVLAPSSSATPPAMDDKPAEPVPSLYGAAAGAVPQGMPPSAAAPQPSPSAAPPPPASSSGQPMAASPAPSAASPPPGSLKVGSAPVQPVPGSASAPPSLRTGTASTLAPGALLDVMPRDAASGLGPGATLPAPSPAPAQVPAAPAPVPAAAPAVNPGASAGRVAIRARSDCWIQVRAADQSIVFSRVLKSGEVYNVPARAGLSLRTGNAGALEIDVDGKPVPSIGGIGALRRDVALDPAELAAGTAVHG